MTAKITIAKLYELGYRQFPCDCDAAECEGFQMLHGDARCYYEYSVMLGKGPNQLTVAEMEVALSACYC